MGAEHAVYALGERGAANRENFFSHWLIFKSYYVTLLSIPFAIFFIGGKTEWKYWTSLGR